MMIDLSHVLQSSEHVLKRKLSMKPESAVLMMERPGGSPVMLRVYDQEVPAYRILKEHTCEYLPQIYEAGEIAGLFVVEEEFIDGVSLQEMIEGGARFDELRTIEISRKICTAIACLHGAGFIHRDIKPEHVLLTAEGRLALIDLDASMRILSGKKDDTQLLGTAMYAAPEQFGITRSDARTDVYAMGILMNEMLTGVHPAAKQYRSGKLAVIIEKCIRINPDDRYQSMAELAAALEGAERKPGRHEKAVLAVILAAAVLLGMLGMAGVGNRAGQENHPENPVYAEGTEWLQLYKYERMESEAFAYREGSQSAKYFTQDGTEVDRSFHVYADESIGVVTGWDENYNAWNLCSEGCDAGTTGYLHAEKDGKHYAIEVLIMGETMSAYDRLPDMRDFQDGYLQSYSEPGLKGEYFIDCTYSREEPVTLYLAAMRGIDTLTPECSSRLVEIEPYEENALWDGPLYAMTFHNPEGGDVVFEVKSEHHSLTFCMKEREKAAEEKDVSAENPDSLGRDALPEKTEPADAKPEDDVDTDADTENNGYADDGAARVPGTDYLQLYKEGQRDLVYFNFRTGSQSAPLYTEDGVLVDETWKVYADRQVGRIENWDTRYSGWRLRSEGCEMGASGYIHAEKDGKHYAIQVRVMGEPMSAYRKLPALADYTDGYIRPAVHPEIMAAEIVRLTYESGKPKQVYLVAMNQFRDLQPACSSSLVTIEPCYDALAWDEPVFTMIFDNPAGGDAMIEVTSNYNHLVFYFEEE